MRSFNKDGLVRISKLAARKEYNNGKEVLFIPCKIHPLNMYGLGIWENKFLNGQYDNFDELCNWFTWYNCDSERGKYIAFYLKKEG